MDSSKSSNITSTTTTITFKADENKQCFETHKAKNVTVIGSCVGTHDHGSSKIKLTNVVDYKWEVKNYSGRLIAVHLDGRHIAYAIKVNNKDGVSEGMVRVFNSVNNFRALIKGMSSEVLDLQFAHMNSIIMLGCIEQTALHVHKIDNLPDKILCTLIVKIEDPIAGHVPLYDKVKWCPFVPEGEDEVDEYVGQQLVWFRGNVYQCYSIGAIVDAHGIGKTLTDNVTEGSLKQKETSPITGATFSPDGSTLSVSCENGVIRFYQIYFLTNEESPRCLHKWTPHGGKPINSVFFLDDHTLPNPDKSLWKYAITTSDNNTERKVWCCSTWGCLQTINFKSPNTDTELIFKAEIDHKSSYLVLSDIKNRGLYVLQIQKPSVQNFNTTMSSTTVSNSSNEGTLMGVDEDEIRKSPCAYVKSISEFPLSSPILSFSIVDAAVRRYKCNYNDNYLLDEMEDYDEECNSLYCVVIRMYLVQPKSVQECRVLYQPSVSVDDDVRTTLSGSYKHSAIDQTIVSELDNVIDNLRNVNDRLDNAESKLENSIKVVNVTSPKSNKIENSIQVPVQPKTTNPINLMTPDSFNSPGKLTPEGVSSEVLSAIRMLAKVQSPSDAKKKTETMNILNLVNNKSLEEHELKIRKSVELIKPVIAASNSPASGGSSPSREVQEILSVKEDSENILNDEFYDDNNDLLDENDADSVEKVIVNEPYYSKIDGMEKSLSLPTVINNNNKTDWPKVPHAPVMSNISNSNTFNNVGGSTPFNDMANKWDQVLEFMQTQACQISELRNLIQMKNNQEDNKFKTFSKNIEFNLTKMIEEYLIRYEREHKKKLEAFIAEFELLIQESIILKPVNDKQNRELCETILHSVPQLVTGQITERLSTIVMSEIQRNVLPFVINHLDKIKAQMQSDVAHKLSGCDQAMKESITKVCSTKPVMETFGNAVVIGIQAGLQKTYSDTLKSTIIPAYQKTTEKLFQQIQAMFMQGTKSYTKQFEAYMSQYQPMQDDSISLLTTMPEKLKSINEATITNLTNQIQSELTKDLKALQATLTKSLRENVKREIQKGFENQAAAINESVLSAVHSQAHTPAPAPTIYDVQEQIKQHLVQGQINTAFHQALVSNDLSLVEFTLEKADYTQVFYPCPLQQPVLLSLIQQISADMNNHNDLKHKYLADAIVSLELRDATTREHAPKITRELYQHCQNFIASNPNSRLIFFFTSPFLDEVVFFISFFSSKKFIFNCHESTRIL